MISKEETRQRAGAKRNKGAEAKLQARRERQSEREMK
jgi:hypothetical protein